MRPSKSQFLKESSMFLIFLCSLLLPLQMICAQDQPVLDLGSRLELFVDHYLIDRLEGTTLRLHPPIPAESVLSFDRPWEGLFCGYVTVIRNGELLQLYYRGSPSAGGDTTDSEVTCYAESRDGVHWERPNLNLYEVQGTRENNVILAHAAPVTHNFAPFLDTHPGVPTEERYKALGGDIHSGLFAFVSADGIHWKKLHEEAVLKKGVLDSQNCPFWSETEGQYHCYLRTWTTGEFQGFRSISRSSSDDFLQWTDPEPMSFGNTPAEHLYTNQTIPYFDAPHVYISLAARFMPGRRVVSESQMLAMGGEKKYSGDCSDVVFLTSRGGTEYDRSFLESYVRPGVGLEHWTSRTNYPARGIVPVGDHQMAFYLQRRYGQKDHYLQRMRLRRDGFASVNASFQGGEMITKPFRFTGKNLVLNYSSSVAGWIKVEIHDATGKVLPGYALEECAEIFGDEIKRVVSWKNGSDLSALSQKPVRLRFAMKDADLYALRFSE
jgi:hypothetical protein